MPISIYESALNLHGLAGHKLVITAKTLHVVTSVKTEEDVKETQSYKMSVYLSKVAS
jgi:hypothetical protein